ncbi:MAG TPA: hypothetical protein GX715_01455 [Armatimonadetes bacterium]|jgi:hypothetical protein|nr:hypothetical protein [Armatimonadota bacterium]
MITPSSLTLPCAVQLVLDDVGWREGWSLAEEGGPWRAGVNRLLGVEDYAAVAQLGEALGTRPQCAMVLCEWDRENVCAGYPTTTHAGPAWDNRHRAGDWASEATELFMRRAAHLEFALHGVGHEHWEAGHRTRAEWYGRDGNRRWPWEVLQGHLECFRRIMGQYDLGPEAGFAFPSSFVPCAFCYYWDDNDAQSTGALMRSAGITRISTPFSSCTFAGGPPLRPDGGFDHGLLVLDRGNSGVPYDAYATVPERLPTTAICGIHWPNVLMPDPARNGESVALWIDYLRRIAAQPDRMLAANTAEAFSQWVYCRFAALRPHGAGRYTLDTSGVPEAARLYAEGPILKLPLGAGQRVSDFTGEGVRPIASWESDGFTYLRLRLEEWGQASFTLRLGESPLPSVVIDRGTCDVLDLETLSPMALRLRARVYGSQSMRLRTPFPPMRVEVCGPKVSLRGWRHDPLASVTELDLEARDPQGGIAEVILRP